MQTRSQSTHIALLLIGLFIGGQPASAETSVFLIFNESVDLPSEANRLESLGGKIHQRIPPLILVADLPDVSPLKNISNLKSAYSSVITLSVLEPLGPLAMAAGMQFNRRMLQTTKLKGAGVPSMRVLVAQKSLPSTKNLTLTPIAHAVRVSWEPVDGALYYEVEGYMDVTLTTKNFGTRTNQLTVDAPLPEGSGPATMYVRVRSHDAFTDDSNEIEEVAGGWSHAVPVTVTATPNSSSLNIPLLTSPNDNALSQGFTLILEWANNSAQKTRVQMSRKTNFQETVYDAIVEGGEFICPSPGLRVGDTLYWRVKSWGDQKSPWTPTRVLRIGEPHHEHSDMLINPEAPK